MWTWYCNYCILMRLLYLLINTGTDLPAGVVPVFSTPFRRPAAVAIGWVD